jgi:hypothetical protein
MAKRRRQRRKQRQLQELVEFGLGQRPEPAWLCLLPHEMWLTYTGHRRLATLAAMARRGEVPWRAWARLARYHDEHLDNPWGSYDPEWILWKPSEPSDDELLYEALSL